MAAGLIDLRTHLHESGNDLPGLVVITKQLLGEPYLFARRTYGDELTFHFGVAQDYTLPKFGNRQRGSHILSTRGSAWLVKSAKLPLLAADWPAEFANSLGRPINDGDLNPGSIAATDATVVSVTPFIFEPLRSYAIRVVLSDGTSLTILPTPNDADEDSLPALSDWEIFAPHGVLKVGPGLDWKYEQSNEPRIQITS